MQDTRLHRCSLGLLRLLGSGLLLIGLAGCAVTPAQSPIPPAPPVAGFHLDQVSGVAEQTTFTATSMATGPIDFVSYDWGDGFFGTAASHVYRLAGHYRVIQSVLNPAAVAISSQDVTVEALTP